MTYFICSCMLRGGDNGLRNILHLNEVCCDFLLHLSLVEFHFNWGIQPQKNLLLLGYVWYNIDMSKSLPTFLQSVFWSYQLADLDTDTHETLIIKQILNHGSTPAVAWLRSTYTEATIQAVIANSMVSEWSKKSLSLWSKVYNTTPRRQSRFA